MMGAARSSKKEEKTKETKKKEDHKRGKPRKKTRENQESMFVKTLNISIPISPRLDCMF
jgi:hypothetical protein